jgi:hypothetical protein
LAFHSGHEAGLVPGSSNEWSCAFNPPILLHGVVLGWGKHRDTFTFLLALQKEWSLVFCNNTNSMEQSPYSEANNHSASQEIPHLSKNPNVHYRVQNSPPLVLILSHMNPVHTFLPYFPNIHYNIILSSSPKPSEWSTPLKFSGQNVVCVSYFSHACYISCPCHHPWFRHTL